MRCQRCGVETLEELRFCLNCGSSLLPKSSYDLAVIDFAYGPDLDAMRTLNAIGPLPHILKNLAFPHLERKMLSRLSATARRVTYPLELDGLVRDCGTFLAVRCLPDVFIAEGGPPNAFTFGTEEHARLVMNSSLLKVLNQAELTAVIAHELGHVKSGHMMYHTLAEALAGGINFSASLLGLGSISMPIQLALLSWHRESEVTADRASLLVLNDLEVMRSLLAKLSTGQADSIDRGPHGVGTLEAAAELFRTHPLDTNRFKFAKEFRESPEFQRARQKIELRRSLLKGLVPVCRFCGQSKPLEELFCPRCGKCQT